MQIELTTYNLQNSKVVMLQMDVEYVIVRNLQLNNIKYIIIVLRYEICLGNNLLPRNGE